MLAMRTKKLYFDLFRTTVKEFTMKPPATLLGYEVLRASMFLQLQIIIYFKQFGYIPGIPESDYRILTNGARLCLSMQCFDLTHTHFILLTLSFKAMYIIICDSNIIIDL